MDHKRGDSFDYTVSIPAAFADGHFVGWTVASQVRNRRTGALVANLSASWVDGATTRDLRLLFANTTAWPLEQLAVDVQFTRTSDSYVLSTNTTLFTVIPDVTQP